MFDNINFSDLTKYEVTPLSIIKEEFSKKGIDFDSEIIMQRRSDSYLSLFTYRSDAPDGSLIDFCRVKAGAKSFWISLDFFYSREPLPIIDDPRLEKVKNKNQRHWKIDLNTISNLYKHLDLIVRAYDIKRNNKDDLYTSEEIAEISHSGIIKSNFVNPITEYVSIDIETTGFSPKDDSILEIGAVKIKNGEIVDKFESFVYTDNPIPYGITSLTGITNDMVASAPNIDEVIQNLRIFIDGYTLVGQNVTFDLRFLYEAYKNLNIEFNAKYLDTLTISRRALPELKSHSLNALCDELEISNDKEHRALSDCIATYRIFEKLSNIAEELIPIDYVSPENRSKRKSEGKIFNAQTRSLQELEKILIEITKDNILTEDEVFTLKEWLDNNQHLRGEYPFERAASAIEKALDDSIIEPYELNEMLEVFKDITDPDFSVKDTSMKIDIVNKKICLTGDFTHGSRSQVSEMLSNKGAVMVTGVSGKTDYLIVGSLGSPNWTNGNYGGKIKKAFEFKDKGKPIQIISEDDFFKLLI